MTLTKVLVQFSEPVEVASATNAANYALNGGGSVVAVARNGLQAVTLTTSALTQGATYTLTANNVRDGATNSIAAGSSLQFVATSDGAFTARDLGGATPAGSSTSVTNGATVSAGGRDIGGSEDAFHFHYQLRAGDFDVAVRAQEFAAGYPWAKAGLMAREDLSWFEEA